MKGQRIPLAFLLPAVTALVVVGCGGDTDSRPAPGGSPTGTKLGKVRSCKDFADSKPTANQELTYARGKDNDGVMGKLVNQTDATMWVGVRTDITVKATTKWCTLAGDASVFFSRDSSMGFTLRNEEPEEGAPSWEYATRINVKDPYTGYAGAAGVYNRSYGWAWEETFKQGESGTFNWGGTKVEVKRENDNTYDSTFKSKTYTGDDGRSYSYLTKYMSDWANFTVNVKGLQSPPS